MDVKNDVSSMGKSLKTGFSRFDDAGRVCPRKRGGARPRGFVSQQFVAYPRNDRTNYGRLWLLPMIPGMILQVL